ncbi:MAG: sulfatase-like hydrolase/transferase, partial [Myxococcales bacterium]|nr:sulfatase-like hydrolase/transferase [Myxococcales bacterium]
MRRVWRRARGRWLTPLGEQLAVGVIVALLSAFADAIVIRVRLRDDPPPWGRLAEATWHLVAQSAPIGLVVGALVGATLVLARESPWLDPARRALAARRWVTPDPAAFATTLALPMVAAGLALGARQAQLTFTSRLHDPGLIAWAVGLSAVGLVVASVVTFAGLHLVLRVVAARMGGFATPLGAALLLLGACAGAAPLALDAAWSFLLGVDVVSYAWLPGLALAYALVALLVRFAIRDRARRWLALALVPLTLAALLHSAFTYGDRGRVRDLVEQRSATGQRLVRFYQGVTDRDGDGHSFAFGGEDCDDTNPTIYPGAPDPEGDGIDSDCFDGDGTRSLEGFLGDGRFRPAPPELHRKNLLFVLVDALRPDHLGSSGYARPTSPHLDAFAERAVVFTNARATSSRSVRSIPSMMSGLYASQLRYGSEYLFPGIREENELLPEVLAEAGYRTSASFGTDYFTPVHGFFQGIEEVVQLDGRGPRHLPVDRALDMLDARAEGDDPFFLWVYLFNVHLPYLHDRHPSAFGLEPVDAYDTEIQLADAELGRLFAELERRGLSEDTVVVLVSDHGEAFGEHNNQGHSFTLYEEEIRSVLMIAAPGVEPRRVHEPVSLLDVAPTVRNLLGLTAPTRVAGRSLVPLMLDREDDLESWRDRPLFAELLPDGLFPFDQKAVIRRDRKLIWWVREGRR